MQQQCESCAILKVVRYFSNLADFNLPLPLFPAKSYIPSNVKTQLNLVTFFWSHWTVRALLNCFWWFSHTCIGKTRSTKFMFLYMNYKVRTKKLNNIKVRKLSILNLKPTFLGQNRQKSIK